MGGKRFSLSEKRLEEIKNVIIEKIHPKLIIVFGSYARGDTHRGSDLDLCIVVSEAKDWFGRVYEFKKKVNFDDIEIEPHIYTEKEFHKMIKEENPFLQQILQEGQKLYG